MKPKVLCAKILQSGNYLFNWLKMLLGLQILDQFLRILPVINIENGLFGCKLRTVESIYFYLIYLSVFGFFKIGIEYHLSDCSTRNTICLNKRQKKILAHWKEKKIKLRLILARLDGLNLQCRYFCSLLLFKFRFLTDVYLFNLSLQVGRGKQTDVQCSDHHHHGLVDIDIPRERKHTK